MRTVRGLLLAILMCAVVGNARAQDAEPAAPATGPMGAPTDAGGGGDDAAQSAAGRAGTGTSTSISGNPGAVNVVTGTGALGRFIGIDEDSGYRLGGLWIGDANNVMTGGLEPGRWGLDSLTIVDFNIDLDKAYGWEGAMFGTQFLQFSAQPINRLAGAFPGYNSLEVTPPFVRQELYQLWYRQSLFDDKLIFRIGKTVPTIDFGNVSKPVPTSNPSAMIPSVTGLIYTPIFVNPTMLGKIPGYYNSATGITTTLAPTEKLYLNYGFYDGNAAFGKQLGLEGPHFNGHYFHIGEIGYAYEIGPEEKPGNFGIGFWGQTGMLKTFNGDKVNGAQGMYFFGTQRLWFQHPGVDSNGVSGFYQFGTTNSNTQLAREYFGAGLTAFGLVPGRPDDTFGMGLAITWMNSSPDVGSIAFFSHVDTKLHPFAAHQPLPPSQTMLAWYYQWKLCDGCFFQPNLTYIPTPGMNANIADAVVGTLRLIVLF